MATLNDSLACSDHSDQDQEEIMEADDSPQIKGAVTISLPPPDNPSMCKTIHAFTVTDTDFLLQQNQTHQEFNLPIQSPRSPPPLQLPQSRFPLSRFFLGTPGKTLGFLCISVLALVIFMSLFHSNILQELKNPNHDKDDDDHHGLMPFIFPLHLREILQRNAMVDASNKLVVLNAAAKYSSSMLPVSRRNDFVSDRGMAWVRDDFVSDRGMAWVPMLGIPSIDFYQIQAEAERMIYGTSPLSLRGQDGRFGGRIVFDSGSSYTYFTREAYSELVSSLKKVSGAGLTQDTSDSTLPLCWRAEFPIRSVDDVRKFFRTITLQFGSQWLRFSKNFRIRPEGYLIISKKGNVCLGILDGSNVYDGSTIILGDVSLRGRLIVYDNVKKQIGWMASDCANSIYSPCLVDLSGPRCSC